MLPVETGPGVALGEVCAVIGHVVGKDVLVVAIAVPMSLTGVPLAVIRYEIAILRQDFVDCGHILEP